MNYWLVKSEPEAYSWDDLVKKGVDRWDGVRNYQARNNLKEMKVGDQVLFYHSVKEKSVVGIAEVVKAHYPDPTTDDDRWVVVDLKPYRALSKPVSLDQIKADDRLANLPLIKQSRLSVMPIDHDSFGIILSLAE
ncbi:EVE domain-containing protein [Penaeicola halotolerans]|uniref:EVE domain-containing protein n=1 Tax=Penaeicola halotolerans TaxID=2793196 RepID=UPI001CF8B979|nr:EVE domain-containing protein [Penaeicola halotolerans]